MAKSFQLAALAGRAHDPIDIWNLIFRLGINKLVYDEGLFLLHVLLKTLKYKFKCFRGVDFKIHAFYSPSNCIAKGVTQKRFLQPSTVGPHDSPSPRARPVYRRPCSCVLHTWGRGHKQALGFFLYLIQTPC